MHVNTEYTVSGTINIDHTRHREGTYSRNSSSRENQEELDKKSGNRSRLHKAYTECIFFERERDKKRGKRSIGYTRIYKMFFLPLSVLHVITFGIDSVLQFLFCLFAFITVISVHNLECTCIYCFLRKYYIISEKRC